ncbi:unnamed protein product [Mycena citricolor]|uniref:LYR motif-containing protein Cup1-like N-terminal domain-containing protein n=1 Tax=Mycena citricolor TaxID=2018698 RepID=A0AAD2HPX5_9AGAR|nr:unnamed protein product [Mycena citricolor]
MISINRHVVFSVYRAVLRETRKLPHQYLRYFWKVKAGDDVRAIFKTDLLDHIRARKCKRLSQDLRKLEKANKRDSKAFDHVLDLAYGRKGKLRRELMEPLLTDPFAKLPPRIIPAEESSRPPVYSGELRALITSTLSKKGGAVNSDKLKTPPKLPERANPESEEARLRGPFSKRREVNIRKRFFAQEAQKVRPPLQVVVNQEISTQACVRTGVRSLPFQGSNIFQDVVDMARAPWMTPEPEPEGPQPIHPPRWLRRRYQSLLDRLPVLSANSVGEKSTYSVSLSPERLGAERRPLIDESSLEWVDADTKSKNNK